MMKKLWDTISRLGYDELLPPEETRRIRLLTRINFLASLVLIFYIVLEALLGIYAFIPGLLLMEFCVIIDLYLIHTKKHSAAKHFSVIIIGISIAFFALFIGKNSFSEALFIPLSAVTLIIFRARKTAVLYLLFFFLLIVVIRQLQPVVPPLAEIDDQIMEFMRLMGILSSVLVTFVLMHYFKSANEDYESQLIGMNGIVSEKNKEITDSINYAQHIQKAILPSAQSITTMFPDSFILYVPKDIVAGDFYWMEQHDHKTIFAVCDCTGHGVPGAMVSVVCSNALHRTVKEFDITDPGKILDKTRELVTQTFERSGSEVKDGMDISLCVFDMATKELRWAGANNPLWIVRNDGIIEYKADKQPVGKSDSPKPFTTHKVPLEPNDSVYAFTDGYADQFGGSKGKKFKYAQLKSLLLASRALSMTAQHSVIAQQLEQWKGDLEQVDDILIMGMKISELNC